MQKGHKSVLSIQIDVFSKYLDGVKKQDILDLAMKIYPVLSSQQPYISLYSAVKRQVTTARGKGVMMGEIANQLITKAYLAGEKLGDKFATLIMEEPEFLARFQHQHSGQLTNNTVVQNQVEQQQQKKQAPKFQQQISSETLIVPHQNQTNSDSKFPLQFLHSSMVQKQTPVSSPLRSSYFLLDSPFIQSKSPELLISSNDQPSSVYKIGVRPGEKTVEKREEKQVEKGVDIVKDSQKMIIKENPWLIAVKDVLREEEEKKAERQAERQAQIQAAQRQKSLLEQRIDSISQKKKNDIERLLNKIDDPLSSAKPVTHSPSKPSFFSSTTSHPSKNSFLFPPPQIKPTQFFQPASKSSKYIIDSSYLPNLSLHRQCLCQTLCQNIVLSQDSFYCQHCENIYHTRCMRKQADSRNCVICHLRLMTPNRVVTQELFVGLLKKNKKRHEIAVQLNEELLSFLKSKKDFEYRLQLRCFRLKQQTQNQTLFPDSCTITINNKQLKEFKPLHKQSSLKYRRDEPISILRNYITGQNKLIITQFNSSNGSDRIEPEDHLVGLYVVEEEVLAETVQRIIRNFGSTLRESKELLARAFSVKGEKSGEIEEEEAITCEVIKIPLTCALTTEKLNYPARGVFCKHFQCFDLKNYIMMTSQSQNPRWVCPICKASCYEFRIDCILTEILNQYTGCDKVDVLVLYKDGMYEVIDRDEDPIDAKGTKLKQPQPKSIDELKIVDKFKRNRGKDAQKEYDDEGNDKKKKKLIQLPPEDQIVDLISDDD